MREELSVLYYPKSFLNCLYYDKTRKHIVEHYNILNIIECSDDKYLETQQNTANSTYITE